MIPLFTLLTLLFTVCAHFTTFDKQQEQEDMSVPGGLSEERPAGPKIQEIADKVKPEAELLGGRTFSEYIAVKYRSQVVAGINYFISVKIGDDEYCHLRVFQNLQQGVELTTVQFNKTVDDPIKYF